MTATEPLRIHLPRLELEPWGDLRVDQLEALAALDRFGVHELVGEPEAADVILFVQCHVVDWRLEAILAHPIARRYWGKVMVYDERDRPWLSFPGAYVCAPARTFDERRQRAASYVHVPEAAGASARDPDLLFSFVGSATARCRRSLLELRHPDAIVEEVRDFMFWDSDAPGYAQRRDRYRDVLARSRFVLCPRGRGTSSFRLYEALAAGRVPVIISDEWVAPEGPNWSAFSLRVRESQIGGLEELLEHRTSDWAAMSKAATEAYEAYFSDSARFHRLGELLRHLHDARPVRSRRWKVRCRGVVRSAHEKARSRISPRRTR